MPLVSTAPASIQVSLGVVAINRLVHADEYTIGVVGVGPRGLSVLERIIENARGHPRKSVSVQLVECRKFGSGDVWRTEQSPLLLMNAVAGQITAFTDETVRMDGPSREGPNLYEWARQVASGAIVGNYSAEVLEEAAQTHPNSYCRRLFYGHYLEWAYDRLKRVCPANVRIFEHRAEAVSVTDTDSGDQVVTLDNGDILAVRHLVLALGHAAVELSEAEVRYRTFGDRIGGLYFPPANPADVDTTTVAPHSQVLVRGLGLCFFDYISLFTEGRGGEFKETESGLSYIPSGDEPRVVCGSRRGLPLHSRAENEKGDQRYEPMFLTEDAIADMRRRSGSRGALDFQRDCWPLIAKEVETVYYTRLIADRESEDIAQEFCCEYAAVDWSTEEEGRIIQKFDIGNELLWNWSRIFQPWTEADVRTPREWQSFVRNYLMADIREARRGNIRSPIKAAVDVIRDIRNEIRYVVNNGGVEGESYQRDIQGWFNSLHSFLSIGPPLRRIEELVALLDSGLVRIAGPKFSVSADPDSGSFVGRSLIAGETSAGKVLVDAMLPRVDLARTKRTILAGLAKGDELKTFSIRSDSGRDHHTGGVAVTRRPYRPIRADGSVHPRRYIFGVPTEGANWVTETTIRGKVNSVTLGDSDAIARSILGLTKEVVDESLGGIPERDLGG